MPMVKVRQAASIYLRTQGTNMRALHQSGIDPAEYRAVMEG